MQKIFFTMKYIIFGGGNSENKSTLLIAPIRNRNLFRGGCSCSVKWGCMFRVSL